MRTQRPPCRMTKTMKISIRNWQAENEQQDKDNERSGVDLKGMRLGRMAVAVLKTLRRGA